MTESAINATPFGLIYFAVAVLVAIAAATRGLWSPCGLSMVSAINPISERSRGYRYWLTAGWFVLGSVLGGTVFGAIAAVGAVIWSPVAGLATATASVAALCALGALASDSAAVPLRLPLHPRQVNERWLGRYRRWVYAVGFGAQIGSGLATYIMTAAVYLTAALGALSGSPAAAVAIGVLFGLVRGLGVLASSRVKDPVALRRLHRRFDLLAPWSHRVVMTVEAAAALVFGFLAAGLPGLVVVAALLAAGGLFSRSRGTVETTEVSCDLAFEKKHSELLSDASIDNDRRPGDS